MVSRPKCAICYGCSTPILTVFNCFCYRIPVAPSLLGFGLAPARPRSALPRRRDTAGTRQWRATFRSTISSSYKNKTTSTSVSVVSTMSRALTNSNSAIRPVYCLTSRDPENKRRLLPQNSCNQQTLATETRCVFFEIDMNVRCHLPELRPQGLTSVNFILEPLNGKKVNLDPSVYFNTISL